MNNSYNSTLCEKLCTIIILMLFIYFLILEIDWETSKWQCNICIPGMKYTENQIATHLSTVHKMEKMFRCPICQFDHSSYYVFERHFVLCHPSMHIKNVYNHFEKVSSCSCPIRISMFNILTCALC